MCSDGRRGAATPLPSVVFAHPPDRRETAMSNHITRAAEAELVEEELLVEEVSIDGMCGVY
ncbi:hypothetical protein GCM10011584_05680 [Nocardioides phosphati]|uniref:Mycofactocin n=1 Tax=Nocardioides phosphati TaxID=1867775 RepID=A0ABQ2N5U8_9ACTN|nr:hypothetical protein GCM10011584_05680 [Nocardioides phosphati]